MQFKNLSLYNIRIIVFSPLRPLYVLVSELVDGLSAEISIRAKHCNVANSSLNSDTRRFQAAKI